MSSILSHIKTVTGNTVRLPYHMLGKRVQSYSEAVSAIGFNIATKPVINPFTNQPQKEDVGLYRSDTFAPLGIHSPNFAFSQPEESLRVLDTAARQVGAQWSSASAINGGRSISAFAILPMSIQAPSRGDKVALSLGFSDTFDGSGKMRLSLCANVLACNNGMVSTQSLCAFLSKHNGKLADRLAIFAGSLAMSVQLEVEAMQAKVSKLDKTPMDGSEMAAFTRDLLGVARDAAPEDIPTRTQTALDSITAGFTRGMGNVGRTRWDAFNAVTEHLDWFAPYRQTENSRADNRFTSLFNVNGGSAKVRERALELLLN